MHADLKSRRRVLVNASKSYVFADDAWHHGLDRNTWTIGNPGSRIRKLYEARDKALQRLVVAQLKIQVAKKRIRDRQSRPSKATLFLAIHHKLG